MIGLFGDGLSGFDCIREHDMVHRVAAGDGGGEGNVPGFSQGQTKGGNKKEIWEEPKKQKRKKGKEKLNWNWN